MMRELSLVRGAGGGLRGGGSASLKLLSLEGQQWTRNAAAAAKPLKIGPLTSREKPGVESSPATTGPRRMGMAEGGDKGGWVLSGNVIQLF